VFQRLLDRIPKDQQETGNASLANESLDRKRKTDIKEIS